jgi:hypothetical protein
MTTRSLKEIKDAMALDPHTADALRTSIRSLIAKTSATFDGLEAEDWIRADVEVLDGLSPSQRDDLIARGVEMARAAVDDPEFETDDWLAGSVCDYLRSSCGRLDELELEAWIRKAIAHHKELTPSQVERHVNAALAMGREGIWLHWG